MNMKKGFTLIELLAVIVILAIISLITTPLIINIISDAKLGSFKANVYGIRNAAENGYTKALIKNNDIEEAEYTYYDHKEEIKKSNIKIEYKGSKPEYGTIGINNKGK